MFRVILATQKKIHKNSKFEIYLRLKIAHFWLFLAFLGMFLVLDFFEIFSELSLLLKTSFQDTLSLTIQK